MYTDREREVPGWRERDLACVRAWLEGGGDPDTGLPERPLATVLHTSQHGNVDHSQQIAMLELLLAAGADLNKDITMGHSSSGPPIVYAAGAHSGSLVLTRWLAEHGATLATPINRVSDDALRTAARKRGREALDVVRFILNHDKIKSDDPRLRNAEKDWDTSQLTFWGEPRGPRRLTAGEAFVRQHRLAPPLMKGVMVLRALVKRGRAAPPKLSRRPRHCNDSELKNVLARLFSPDVPTRSFRRVVEFWLGRGLPYEYSRTYDLREMDNWIMTSDGLMPPSELTPVTA